MRAAVRGLRARTRRPLVAGLAVALLAGILLTITHREARLIVPPRVAIRAALGNAQIEHLLAGSHWNHITVNSLDDQLEHVTFFRGGRLVESATVDRGLTVKPGVDGRTQNVPYGNWIAYEPAVLAVLAAVFVLMAGVTPWRRLRNLDVAACVTLVAPVVLLEHEYIDASVLAALPGLLWLLLRCARGAFATAGRPVLPATPLLHVLTPDVDPARRVRWLRWLLAVFVIVFVMVDVGSINAVDVIYAVMEGSTRLLHGVLPYGHLPPGVVHGDTYPILSYALYVPIALFAPVNNTWDSVVAGLGVAVAMALLAAWAMFRGFAGAQARFGVSRRADEEEAGLRAALAWLAFPPLLITASTGTTDVMLAAMLAGALLLWRRPAACSSLLAVAGWFKLAPFALLPVFVAPLRGRRLLRALVAVVLVSLVPMALLLALGGLRGPIDMLHAMSFQFSRGSLQSVWSVLGLEALQPLAQACVLGLIAAAVVKLWREPELAGDRARMAALAAAILLGLQLSADYWAFLYLVWVIPLIGLSLLAVPAPAALPAEASVPAVPGPMEPAAALAA